MQDLSKQLLPGDPISALVPTSQTGGNQVWDQSHAHTAPGGASGDLGDGPHAPVLVSPPKVEVAATLPPGTDGKPKARQQTWTPPGPPAWKATTVPDVVREK